jgi:hypothetical protein
MDEKRQRVEQEYKQKMADQEAKYRKQLEEVQAELEARGKLNRLILSLTKMIRNSNSKLYRDDTELI